ncbi:PREDICTED: heme-binding protein 2-like [Amphimedon queenslandica]|uniref:Heme-binding protein 2 n=1 Tax=Amphimedon queenslandica TaxID=400682 RepID=A0A1X7VNP7_AMPQE|nr:PREDICTED: heme-binding protein 2-like [Amphimedon queenslandica]|eukprot:XP_019863838.1 PREDICTED: heme-binding protein 2-like [Amphimedon queenslandica]
MKLLAISGALVLLFSITGAFSLYKEDSEKPSFCRDFDCPTYTVVAKKESYEERKYDPSKWVGTTIGAMNWTSALDTGYSKLYKYRNGANKGNVKIPMATPVATKIEPGQGPACESNFTILFFVPFKYQDNTPVPTDSSIAIVNLPSITAYVGSFGGFENEDNLVTQATDLATSLANNNIDFVQEYYFTAEYDSPDKKIDRHNEIWFLAKN